MVLEKTCLEGYKKLGKRVVVLEAIRKQLRYFTGRQLGLMRWWIRNTTTPAGNIVTASPISDLNSVLIASGTVLTAQSKTCGEFLFPMKEFFVAYPMTPLPADSITTKSTIPLRAEGTRNVIKSYKQAKRKANDITIVRAGFRVVLNDNSVMDISLAYGGVVHSPSQLVFTNESRMAPKTVEAKNTMEAFLGKKWFDKTVLEGAMAVLSCLKEWC
ncbi:hypothetical protein L873DRAFT_1791844 [Choiromyces venosus 120613-1]|uniref:Uncharacterized protein n=1 Tax=Choiromyces venosus 120613-1 TaxID=1336337 RepID=A0A3N4JQJ0_9PEZI|nr:hypothetical protein L873DRAFT_1791844 [Choiromyces venosus 120613-1]